MTGEFRGMMTDGHKFSETFTPFYVAFQKRGTLNYFVVSRA